MEESGDLSVDVLNGLLLSLVGLKNLQKLFVNFRLILETILEQRSESLLQTAQKESIIYIP